MMNRQLPPPLCLAAGLLLVAGFISLQACCERWLQRLLDHEVLSRQPRRLDSRPPPRQPASTDQQQPPASFARCSSPLYPTHRRSPRGWQRGGGRRGRGSAVDAGIPPSGACGQHGNRPPLCSEGRQALQADASHEKNSCRRC